MKKYTIILSGLIMVFSVTTIASALPFCDIKTGRWSFASPGVSHSWNFDLDNDSLMQGDINPEDSILPFVALSIEFYDNDHDRLRSGGEKEYAALFTDGYYQDSFEVDRGFEKWYGSIWFKVLFDHKLTVTLTNIDYCGLGGDFRVNKLKLSGNYCDIPTSCTPVPEPGTMLMLGFVLLGLVAVSRKRFNNKKAEN